MTTTNHLDALRELGFTEIEALVYSCLLRSAPSTGYRISHEIGKPTANTYKAIASLEQRGAVQIDEGDNRLVRAVPPAELLAQMGRRFEAQRARAEEALADLDRDLADDRVYSLKDVPQVLERARAMLGRAEEIVLGDLFPAVLDALAGDLAAAATRGVRIVVKVYAPARIEGVETILQPHGERIFVKWPGEQLSLVVDSEEHLLALLDRDLAVVHQAVWSRSTFLSCLHHNHLAMEQLVTAHARGLETSPEAADAAFEEHLQLSVLTSETRGLERLRSRYGDPDRREDPSS